MFRGNIFVLKVGGLFEGLFQQLISSVRKRSLRRLPGNLGKLFDLAIEIAENSLRANADLFEHRRNDTFFVFKQGSEQMHGQQLRIAVLGSEFVRALDGFLRFYSEFVPTDRHRNSI